MEPVTSVTGQGGSSVRCGGAIPAAIVELGSRARAPVVEANRSLERLLGAETGELCGADVCRWIDPAAAWSRLHTRVRRSGTAGPVRVEVPVEAELLPCDAYLAPIDERGRGLLQIVPTADRRQGAQELRASERRLQAILDNVPALVYVKDLEGRYVLMNRRCQDKFSIAPGMVDSQWAPAAVAAHYVAHDREVLGRGAPQEFHETVREDGRDRRYISLKFPLYDDRGVAYAVAGVSTDITAVKDAEAAAERARELAERASRAKSEFLSRVSHELRTPMNSIVGYAQLLAAGGAEDPAVIAPRILDAGQHLLNLINELLEISRIEQGVQAVEIAPVHACDPVAQAVALAGPLASARDVELDVDLHEGLYVFVAADAQRLRQVLLNLIANGVTYGPSPGRVTIACKQRGERLRFCVTDDGAGPPIELVDRLFTPFDRLDRADDGTGGVGLGLSLCKALVEAMGGSAGYERGTPVGTTFWVELPVTAPPADAHDLVFSVARRPCDDGPLAGTARVLYVEDNAANLDVVARALRRLGDGVEMVAAPTLAEGRQRLGEGPVDAVLLDLHLPDGSGLALLEVVRRTRPDLPVVVLSADATARQIDRVMRAGATHYLTKPLDLDLLVSTVRGALRD